MVTRASKGGLHRPPMPVLNPWLVLTWRCDRYHFTLGHSSSECLAGLVDGDSSIHRFSACEYAAHATQG